MISNLLQSQMTTVRIYLHHGVVRSYHDLMNYLFQLIARGVDEKFFICDGEGPAEDYGPPGCFFGFDPDAICGHLWAIPEVSIPY